MGQGPGEARGRFSHLRGSVLNVYGYCKSGASHLHILPGNTVGNVYRTHVL